MRERGKEGIEEGKGFRVGKDRGREGRDVTGEKEREEGDERKEV